MNELVEAGGEAGVGLDELLHEVGVPSNDDDEGISVVLHGFEYGIHGFLTVVSLFVGSCEGVSLIDEEDAAHGFLDDLLSFDGGLTDKACDEAGAVHFHHVIGGEHAHGVVDFCEDAGDGGFAGAGVAVKDEVV